LPDHCRQLVRCRAGSRTYIDDRMRSEARVVLDGGYGEARRKPTLRTVSMTSGSGSLRRRRRMTFVDGALGDLEVCFAPGLVEELDPRERPAAGLDQLAQDGELDRGERDRLAAKPQGAAVEIERELAEAQATVGDALPVHAAVDGTHTRSELAWRDRGDGDVVEAGGEQEPRSRGGLPCSMRPIRPARVRGGPPRQPVCRRACRWSPGR